MTQASGPDWEAVRRDYVACEITVEEIAQRHAISRYQVMQRQSQEGWPARYSKEQGQRKRGLRGRMVAIVEAQIHALEVAMRENGRLDTTEMRLLDGATKIYERLTAKDAVGTKAQPAREKKPNPELEAVRARLLERVEAIEAQ